MPWALFKKTEDDAFRPTRKSELPLPQADFYVHKFNNRPKPKDRNRIVIISCFSEFGCETIGVTHCIPRLMKMFPGKYVIAMGWYGRSYLYKHLVDEFWELDESHMHLRDRTFAFHHDSVNLKAIEEKAAHHGMVIPSVSLGRYAIGNYCKTCGHFWNEWRVATPNCPSCSSTNIQHSLFGSAEASRALGVPLPRPSKQNLEWAESFVKKPCVGIFARGRKTYGRNLTPEFYTALIHAVRERGYEPVWLGEKQSTQPCPVSDVVDFSRMPESRDLEKTLAIICQCEFTIQFWTASSRLAGLMGVPFILVESPDQIYCTTDAPGQEGRRLELTTFGKKKLVIANYLKALNSPDMLLNYTCQAIEELRSDDCGDLVTDLVEEKEMIDDQKDRYYNLRNR